MSGCGLWSVNVSVPAGDNTTGCNGTWSDTGLSEELSSLLFVKSDSYLKQNKAASVSQILITVEVHVLKRKGILRLMLTTTYQSRNRKYASEILQIF